MSREYKFRARSLDTDKWVYGSLLVESLRYVKRASINVLAKDEEDTDKLYEVYWSTVGQWTGRTDKAGTEVYEGDMVRVPAIQYPEKVETWDVYEIKWNIGMCALIADSGEDWLMLDEIDGCEVCNDPEEHK